MKIVEWVKDKYENSELQDIAEHGCVSGCASGMVYYFETVEFYDKFQDEIWDMLYDAASNEGINVMQFISLLNGAREVGSDYQFKNLLAWYAVEETAKTILGNW